MTLTRTIHRSQGGDRVFGARLMVISDFALDASNYWTFTLMHRRIVDGVLQTYGELVGEAYTTQTRSLTAGVPVTIYEDAVGRPMQEGELLVLTIISTGSPSVPDDARIVPDIRPNAR